ncbi:Lpp/OprI family alanine-zipper lipoprotein [Granulosicoccaceae sp. 1_MG-2023]|nr:Lpp/OprI family alanine-zipper lipoprotein [Granulosicoccaceae sp. 1_MG-2023]
MKRSTIATLIPAALAVAVMTGCASNASEPDELTSLKEQVAALKDGNMSSMSTAEEALAAANEAKADAANALSVANEAKSMSEATDAKIDQMFKKAMYK